MKKCFNSDEIMELINFRYKRCNTVFFLECHDAYRLFQDLDLFNFKKLKPWAASLLGHCHESERFSDLSKEEVLDFCIKKLAEVGRYKPCSRPDLTYERNLTPDL